MDFLTGAFFVVGLRRSQGLVGTGGVRSDGRKSHDRAGSFTGSQALRVHDDRARPVSWQSSGKREILISRWGSDADVMMSALRRLCVYWSRVLIG